MQIYIVKQGDTVNKIASSYGVTQENIICAKQLI